MKNKGGGGRGGRGGSTLGQARNKPGKRAKSSTGGKGAWNQVPIGEELLSNKDFEHLVSFEELVDYDVLTASDGTKEILYGSKNGSRKRKPGDEEVTSEEIEESVTKKKLKGSSSTKRNGEGGGGRGSETINTSAGLVVVEEEDTGFEDEEQSPPPPPPEHDKVKRVKEKKKRKKPPSSTEKPEPEEEELEENTEFNQTAWVQLGVPDLILKALQEQKFNTPTTIQTLTLPSAILGQKDVVGAAETGSGKTLAFAIPIIDGILKQRETTDQEDGDGGHLKALILTPTRELAVQIKNHLDAIAKYSNVKSVVIVGGLSTQKQERLLRAKPDIVIATPGRLWELVQEGDPHLSTLPHIKYLAIDETDRMVERGHFQELEGILTAVNSQEISKESRQNFVFSATLSFTHEPPKRLKAHHQHQKMKAHHAPKKLSAKEKLKQIMELVGVRPNPKIVDITTSKGTCESLTEMQLNCSLNQKDYYLYYFLVEHPGRTIVFCNSINCVRRLVNLFFLLQVGEVLPLHADMNQKMRLRSLEKFTGNPKGVLIATDVAARGLDIQNIEHVIHYQVPKTAESYIHRSGRTARAFKGGSAILFVEPAETTTVHRIFRSLGRTESLPNFQVDGNLFRDLKSTVEMAVKVEQFEHQVRKKLADHNWMEKAKKDMELATSSEEEESDDEQGGATSQKKALMNAKKKLDKYKKQLSQMIAVNNQRTLNGAP